MDFVAPAGGLHFVVWAADRVNAGQDDDCWGDEVHGYGHDELSFFAQFTHSFIADFGVGSVQYQDLCTQMRVRDGFELPPWGYATPEETMDDPELTKVWQYHLEGFESWEDYEYALAHDEEYEEQDEGQPRDPDAYDEPLRVMLPTEFAPFRPELIPSGAMHTPEGWVLVWGDRLWRDRSGVLHEWLPLPRGARAYSQRQGRLVLRTTTWEFLVLEEGAWTTTPPWVPIAHRGGIATLGAQGPDEFAVLQPLHEQLTPAVFAQPSACGGYLRAIDRLGRGGVYDAHHDVIGHAGGPFEQRCLPVLGDRLDGELADHAFWRALWARVRAFGQEHPDYLPPSAFARSPEGALLHTDNGLSFYKDGELLFVLERPARCVDFSPTGHEALVGYDDEAIRIDIDSKRVLCRWSRPARFSYLRILLAPYEPDSYVEQVTSLWEILGVNQREG